MGEISGTVVGSSFYAWLGGSLPPLKKEKALAEQRSTSEVSTVYRRSNFLIT
jgi:hypothetical protein